MLHVPVSQVTDAQVAAATKATAPPKILHTSSTDEFLRWAADLHNKFFLVCTRAHESDTAGGYITNTGNGYYGAYQYLIGTWNWAAAHYGAPQYVGVLPSNVPGFWQDLVTWNYYLAGGNGPWGGRC